MKEKISLEQQLGIMKERLLTAGMNRRDVMKVAAAAAAGAGLSVAGAKSASASAGSGRYSLQKFQDTDEQVIFHYGISFNPTSFDFNLDLYCGGEETVWAGVVQFDENLNAVGDWAETFTPNEDASVWTFNIRQNNTGWSDGNPVTAHDFVWSWTRQLDPASAAPYAGFLFDIKYAEAFNQQTEYAVEGDPLEGQIPTADDLGVKALDDWTLEITCEGPRGFLPQVLGYTASFPSPRWMVEEHGTAWALGGDVPLVSNGPFKLDNWEYDVKIEMSKNENFWDAANIKMDRVVCPITPTANAVLAFEEGSGDARLDWTPLSGADYQRYLDDPELSAQLSPYVYPGLWMLLPSNGIPPFDLLEVRQAVSHAIDRERLVTITNGLVTPGYCMVPQGVFGFLDDPALQEIQSYDPEAAVAALAGTEFEGGQNWPEITMWMRANEEIYNADVMANDIADQLQQVLGMTVSIQPVPLDSFSGQLYENQWQLVFIRWWLDYPDPNNVYSDMFYSRKATGRRQAWSNDQFDDLVLDGKAEADPAKRLEIYLEAEKVIQGDVGYMPLVFRLDQYVFKPWVKGIPVNDQGYQVPDGNIYIGMNRLTSIEGREN
ncbi:MAG: peptide ABC transporter substrate-binding protein [Thermomicrobiales bacterium]|nr:peptide ABC transporter substrate-binding protein [Thermomicrobiales bacterium]